MIRLLGSDVMVLRCTSSPQLVGTRGTVMLESMKTITIVSQDSRRLTLPKKGTAFQLSRSDEVVIADDMVGRLEERLARGSSL